MLEQLEDRERLFLLGGLTFVVLLGLIFGLFQIRGMRARIAEDVARSRENVGKIQRLHDDIRSMGSTGALPDMNRFLSMTETLLGQHQLKPQNIRNRVETKKTEELMIVDLSFNGVPLRGIMNFIYDIEYGKRIPACRVGNSIFRKPLPNRDIYDIKISLMISRPKAGGKKKRRRPSR